jgi:hypothetical protein
LKTVAIFSLILGNQIEFLGKKYTHKWKPK